MQIIDKYNIVTNCQYSKDKDSIDYNCKHYDAVLATAGLYINYIAGTPFRIDLTIGKYTDTFNTVEEFYNFVDKIALDLKELNTSNKPLLFVFTWNLKEVVSFFELDKDCANEAKIKDTIILRDVRALVPASSIEDFAEDWYKVSRNTAPSVLFAKFSDEVYNEYTINNSNGKVFKTTAQTAKYELRQKAPAHIKSWINHVVPYPDVYHFLRYECFRASLCTNNGDGLFENVLSFDQSSAHAHKLVCKEFPISRPVKAAMNQTLEWYFANKWCWFRAHFTNVCPKDGFEKSDTFKVKGRHNITLALSTLSLEAFNLCYDYESVEYTDLVIANKGYLDDWIRCAIADMYVEKASYKVKDAHRNAIKVKLNSGSYGIHVERLYDYFIPVLDDNGRKIGEEIKQYSNREWADCWKDRFLPPQVGITITDYVFLDEVRIIAANPQTFAYCDTDSIKFSANKYDHTTFTAINKRNEESHKEVKAFCDQFNYDYEFMKDLGEYKLDAQYRLLKAVCPKEYIYMTIDGKLGATTAGFASHWPIASLDTHYKFEKNYIPAILYYPISKQLDPFRYFSMGSKYEDYKWVWYSESKVRNDEPFNVTIKENALLEKDMRDRYEA